MCEKETDEVLIRGWNLYPVIFPLRRAGIYCVSVYEGIYWVWVPEDAQKHISGTSVFPFSLLPVLPVLPFFQLKKLCLISHLGSCRSTVLCMHKKEEYDDCGAV